MQIFTEQCAVIGDPALMKRVLQTNLKNYAKDLEFSYSPFIVRALSGGQRRGTPHASSLDPFRTSWAPGWSPAKARYGISSAR